MLDNGFEYVLRKNERFVGNGHNSRIIQDDEGSDWMLYHGVDVKNPHGRVLLLDRVRWTKDDWPYVSGNSPSLNAVAPVFKSMK